MKAVSFEPFMASNGSNFQILLNSVLHTEKLYYYSAVFPFAAIFFESAPSLFSLSATELHCLTLKTPRSFQIYSRFAYFPGPIR
jgi:hypothetical protein